MLSYNMHTRGHLFKLPKPPAYHLCNINFLVLRQLMIGTINLTSDIVTNSSLSSFKLAVDNYYFYDFRFMFQSQCV